MADSSQKFQRVVFEMTELLGDDDGVLFVEMETKKLRKRFPSDRPICSARGCGILIKYTYRCVCEKMYLVHNSRGKQPGGGPMEYVTCCPCGARDRIIFRDH